MLLRPRVRSSWNGRRRIPRTNFRATSMPNWNGVIDCEVLVIEPNSRLS
jgi:hypothetical protein